MLTQPLCCVSHWAWRKERSVKSCLWIWEKKLWKNMDNFKATCPSPDLNVPVSTVRNINKRFTAHGTVANLPGHGRKSKINEKLQWRIVRMVDKEPRLTSKLIQADLQTQGTTVSARTICRHLNEKGRYGRRPRRIPLLTQRHKKARLEFGKTYVTKPQSFWENVLWTDETKVELFGKGHHGTVYRKKMRPSKKRTQSLQTNMVEVQRCFGVALLLLALDALTVWNVSWNLMITKEFWGAM